MLVKSSKHSERNAVMLCPTAQEARDLVYSAAEPVKSGESIKSQRRRSMERLGMHTSKTLARRHRGAWYGEAGCWGDDIMRDLKARVLRWRCADQRKTNDARIRMSADFDALADSIAGSGAPGLGPYVERLRRDAAALRSLAPD